MQLLSKHRRVGQSSRIAIAVALAIPGAVALPAVSHAQEAAQDFNIAGGDLAAALQRYSAATGVQLIYSSDLVAGKRSPGVSGRMSPQQALGQLLAGSGLSARVSGNTATLVLAGAAGDVAAAEGERLLGPVRVEGSQGGSYQAPVRGEGIAQLGGIRGGQDEEAVGYRAKVASIATGSPVAIEDIPRSISVLTQDQIEKQSITTLADALSRAPGVVITDETNNTGEGAAIYIRGLPVTSFAIDGVSAGPANSGNSMRLYGGRLSLDQYERVEIIRGPNALFTGEGSPGGSVNLVRKRPSSVLDVSLTAEGGSFGRYGGVADYSTPSLFGSPIAFRAVLSARNEGSEVEHYKAKNALLYGIFDAPLGDAARMEFGGSYTIANTDGLRLGAFRAFNGPLLDLPRDFSLDRPFVYSRDRTWNVFSKLFVDLAEDWNVEIGADYRSERGRGTILGISAIFREDGTTVFPGDMASYQRGNSFASNLTTTAQLTGRFETFGLTHNVFARLNYATNGSQESDAGGIKGLEYYMEPVNSINDIINPVWTNLDFSATGTNRIYSIQNSQTGIVFGDNISWREMVTLGLTVRKDISYSGSLQVTRDENAIISNFNPISSTWRPSFSVSVKPIKNVTLYGSYADGFSRLDGIYSRSGEGPNYTYATLAPSTWKNYEAGIRYANGAFLAGLSAYRQELTGGAVADPLLNACPPLVDGAGGYSSPCYFAGGVDTTTKGIDVELSGRLIDGLDIVFNYNYNDSEQVANPGVPLLTVSPQSSGNLFLDWQPSFAPDLRLQLGARYKSRYYQTGTVNIYTPDGQFDRSEDYTVEQNPYVTFDLGIDYRIDDSFSARLFVENITNKDYFSTPSLSNTFYAPPRTFLASLKWKRRDASSASGISPTNGRAPFGNPADWYAGFGIGTAITGDIDATADGFAQDNITPVAWTFETKDKPSYVFQLGKYFGDNLRGEIEGQYRGSSWGRIGGAQVAPFGVCGAIGAPAGEPFDCDKVPGKIESIALMGNLIYEFGKRDAPFRPFLGVGAGIARHNVQLSGKMLGIGPDTPWRSLQCFPPFGCFPVLSNERPQQESINGIDVGYDFTWQAMAGASVKLTNRLRLDGTWRYTSIPGLEWETFNLDGPAQYGTILPITPRVGTFNGDYSSHLITIGLRWSFGARDK